MKGKREVLAVKLDFNKAYDRVQWDFLEEVMIRMGFNRDWVHLIMQVVTTVSYSITVNGESKFSFKPERGLRQGILSHHTCSSLSWMFFLISLFTKGSVPTNFLGSKLREAAPTYPTYFLQMMLFFLWTLLLMGCRICWRLLMCLNLPLDNSLILTNHP